MFFALCVQLESTANTGTATNQADCANLDFFATYQSGDAGCTDCCTNYSTTVDSSITSSSMNVNADLVDNCWDETDGMCNVLALQYANADNGTKLTVGMICNSEIERAASVIGPLVMVATNEYTTTLTGDLACPTFSMNAFFSFVEEYNWLFAIILMCIGLPFCFYGRKLFSCIVFTVGILLTVSIVMLLFYSTFLDSSTEAWVFWVVLSCSFLGGIAVGFVLFKCQKLGAACIAGWGGFLGGLIINTTFLFTTNQNWLFWVVAIGCALTAALLAFVSYIPTVITVTSFAGAYMFIRGISLFWPESYPNEFTLINELESGAISNIEYYFYLYLGFMIAFTVLGMIVQCKHYKAEVEEKGEDGIHHPYANRY